MKRILSLAVVVVLLLALAVPVASAADTYPIRSDMSTIIVGLNSATISPVNPMALGASANIDYHCDSKMVSIVYDYETIVYNGVSYPRVRVARVSGYVPGTYTIEARLSGTTLALGSTTITVISSMATGGAATVTASNTNLATYGSTTQLYVPGDSIIACSVTPGDEGHFSVTNSGLVTSLVANGNYGYTDVNVYTASGKYGTIRIYAGTFPNNTAAAASPTINIGGTTQLYLLDGSTIVSASSSNTTVATVTANGLVTGRTNGTCQIYVMSQRSAGVVNITVGTGGTTTTGAASLLKSTIAVGESTYLVAGSDVIRTCVSSNPAVVSASTSNIGQVTGVAAGTALLTYTTYTGKTGSVTITVTGSSSGTNTNLPAPSQSFSTSVGKAKLLSYSNLSKVWTADPAIASVSITTSGSTTKARVLGLKAGSTTVYLESTSGTVKALTVNVEGGSLIGSTAKIASGDPDLRVIARKSASSSGSVLATLSNNVSVTIKGESGDYYQVTFKSSSKTYTGYVKKQYITF